MRAPEIKAQRDWFGIAGKFYMDSPQPGLVEIHCCSEKLSTNILLTAEQLRRFLKFLAGIGPVSARGRPALEFHLDTGKVLRTAVNQGFLRRERRVLRTFRRLERTVPGLRLRYTDMTAEAARLDRVEAAARRKTGLTSRFWVCMGPTRIVIDRPLFLKIRRACLRDGRSILAKAAAVRSD